MAGKSKNVVVEEVVEAVVEPVVEEVVVEKKATRSSVTVVYRAGIREYSRDVHGEDFVGLAQEFADKKKGTLV